MSPRRRTNLDLASGTVTQAGPTPLDRRHLVVLGASTGGPGALREVLKEIPKPFSAPVVVVQHIKDSFIEGFARWLAIETAHHVELATEGRSLQDGTVYVADARGDLTVTAKFIFHYSAPCPGQLFSPNIDSFFLSVAKLDVNVTAALLTGMGSDGALGLFELNRRGCSTYVQTGATCIVNGMPEAARKLSSRHRSASPQEIGRQIRRMLRYNTKEIV